jgi:toxin YoeB
MNVNFTELGWRDYAFWVKQDKKTLKTINSLIDDIARNYYRGIGKPEPLSGNLSGWWSREIDKKTGSFIGWLEARRWRFHNAKDITMINNNVVSLIRRLYRQQPRNMEGGYYGSDCGKRLFQNTGHFTADYRDRS